MSGISFELLFLLLLLLANGLLSMSEMAVVSSRKAKLQQLANEGNARARVALDLANDPNRFLSTVQVGITLISTLTGALGGATLAERLAGWLATIPALARYSQAISLTVVVIIISYLTLILGELAPKRLALYNPERIAGWAAGPMRLLSRLAFPAVALLSFSTDAVIRLLGLKSPVETPVSEEEIQVLLKEGTEAGIFEESEQDMVEGVFRLGERRVSALMTPWTEVVWLDINDSLDDIRQALSDSHFSRFPVCEGTLDQVRGIVQAKDLLARVLTGAPLDLKASLQKAQFVPESMPAAAALEMFRRTHIPFALVIDEYGGIAGLVTMTDIVEEIVGDIEPGEPEAVQRQDGSWLLDGMMLVEDMKELLKIGALPDEEEYQTVGGFVMMQLGRVPAIGESFEWQNYRFEVVDMDGNRVDKLLVQQLPSPPEPEKDPKGL